MTGLDPIATEGPIEAGALLGRLASHPESSFGRLTVQVSRLNGDRPPFFVRPSEAASLEAGLPRPVGCCSAGRRGPPPRPPAQLLAERDDSFATVQEHYYADPPRIERGWREHLIDTDGRSLPRHGEQRRDDRARASAAGRSRVAAVGPAEHELAVPLRGGRRVQRAAGGARSRPARHGVPGEQRQRGGRPGAAARDDGDRAPDRARHARGVPRLDHRLRCRLVVDRRQPARARDPARLGAPRRRAAHVPRHASRRRLAVRRTWPTSMPSSPRSTPTASTSPASSPSPSTATRAACCCPTATSPACTRGCARAAGCASRMRCRSDTDASASTSGASSSRASCPTSSRSRRRWATGIRSAP